MATPKSIDATWKQVDRLIDERKLQEAVTLLDAIVEQARAAGDEAAWAKALVRRSQLAAALGGFETAVEQLKAAAWPSGSTPRAAVELYYAHALLDYLSAYDWEIRQRERVASGCVPNAHGCVIGSAGNAAAIG